MKLSNIPKGNDQVFFLKKEGLKPFIQNTNAKAQMSFEEGGYTLERKIRPRPGLLGVDGAGPGPRPSPVFWLSNCLKALMRSDLWANSCSRRTLRAERSVLPMLRPMIEEEEGEKVKLAANITTFSQLHFQQERRSLAQLMKDYPRWAQSLPLPKCQQKDNPKKSTYQSGWGCSNILKSSYSIYIQ